MKNVKEVTIVKDKFQEFRRNILANLGVVLKIVFGDKYLMYQFDTKKYMDYKPKNITVEEYTMNMVERDIHEVYNIMTKGHVLVMTGSQLEKKDLTDKYIVSTLVSTDNNTKETTHTENKTKDGKKEMVNVRVLEEKIEIGALEGYALESAKQTLEKIENRTTGVDTWVLENNEGIYGTEIVITKEGHIDLYLCIMEKYSSKVSYIRVGNFQQEFEVGDVWLQNGKVKEYKKLGTIINALNKEYEQYGFYFTADTKNNRKMLADARKSYEFFVEERKETIRKENLIKDLVTLSGSTLASLLKELGHEGEVTYTDTEKLERELVKFCEESDKKYDCWQDVFVDYKKIVVKEDVIEKVTFDIDGEGSLHTTEKKDVDYVTAQKEYRLRLQSAPKETYNKTNFDLKINGECVYGFRVDLCRGFDHKFELADELLRNLKFQRRVWSGEEYSWMQGEYREKRIKEQFDTEEEMIKFFDKIEEILVGFGTPEPTPNSKELVEVVVEKMEEKEMNTINKNTLTNRMTKLGEFLKENRDKDVVENKVYELFPNAIEVEVFNGDDVVYFLVGQDYVGKKPTRKEMKEQDNLFKEIDKMYGLSVYVSVNEEKIKIESSVGVDYRDIYNHTHYTDCTVKEIEIELDLTMEVAKELAEDIREQNDKGTLSACYSWNRINDLCKRNTTDEVLDFLESEKQYYNKKEEEERKQKNIEYINKTINTSYQLFAEGTISVEKILEKLKKLEGYCHEYALLKKVEDARKLFERAEDSMWREVVRKEVVKILEEKYNQMLQEKIEILEKEVTSETTAEDAKEILGKLGKHIKKIYDIKHNGFCYETEPLLVTCYGVGGKENIPNGCDKVLYTKRLRYGIHLSEEEFISMYIVGDIVVEKDEDTKIYENRRVFYKEIPLDTDQELEEIQESEAIDELEKKINNHIDSIIDMVVKFEKDDREVTHEKTVAVVKNGEYELTSSFKDTWTGMTVYVGNSGNILAIPNSEKSILTQEIDLVLDDHLYIKETVEKIKKKIKMKFECSYSKSVTIKEEEEVYVLKTPSDVELFWYYKDAYSRMEELVNEMSERFSNSYEVTIDDYSAKMETFSWKITTKKVK